MQYYILNNICAGWQLHTFCNWMNESIIRSVIRNRTILLSTQQSNSMRYFSWPNRNSVNLPNTLLVDRFEFKRMRLGIAIFFESFHPLSVFF